MRVWLKEIRLSKHLTQQEVADQAGVQRAYYTMVESGARTPSVAFAKSIGKTLGFNWTIFFDNQSNETLPNERQTS